MRYEDENPGEWQVDPKTGERYRMIGRIKEYELMVRVDGIEIPPKPTCRLPQTQERGRTGEARGRKERTATATA